MKLKQMRFMLTIILLMTTWFGATAETKSIIQPSNGVYVFDMNGDFYTSEAWNVDNNSFVLGIALITDNTKALIALKNANTNGYVVWGPDGLVDGVVTTASNSSNGIPGVAESDYNGANNTQMEVQQLSPESNTALYLANAYLFPNDQNGYLPALGELIDMYENIDDINNLLEKVNGEKIEDFWYWSSTQHYLYYRAWAYGTDSKQNKWIPFAQLRNENSPLADSYGACRINVRPFGTIPQSIEIEDVVHGKCASPTISVENGKVLFSCDTEGVIFHYTITSLGSMSGKGNSVELQNNYIVSVFAAKDGYDNSDTVTEEVKLVSATVGFIGGDVNNDGKVNTADIIAIVNKMLVKEGEMTGQTFDYFWIMGDGEFYINFNNSYSNIEFSFDKVEWIKAVPTSAKDFSTFTKVPSNQKIYLRGENGISNSFWGSDWWGCIRTTTEAMYYKWYNTGVAMDSCFSSYNSFYNEGAKLFVGGNLLSLVYGDKFNENSASVVESTLSRILSGNTLIYDASNLYVVPKEYGTNKGSFSSYGQQYGTFQWCHHLTKGPHIKYFSKDLFSYCENLKEIFYEGDGAESDVNWFNNKTSICADKLIIHVRKGIPIKNKPANAVVVEDIGF